MRINNLVLFFWVESLLLRDNRSTPELAMILFLVIGDHSLWIRVLDESISASVSASSTTVCWAIKTTCKSSECWIHLLLSIWEVVGCVHMLMTAIILRVRNIRSLILPKSRKNHHEPIHLLPHSSLIISMALLRSDLTLGCSTVEN